MENGVKSNKIRDISNKIRDINPKKLKKIIITLVAVFLIAAGIIGGAYYTAFYKMTHKTDTHDLSEKVGELSQKFIDQKHADCFVIAICKNGKTYTQSYGKLDTISNELPTDSTVFATEKCNLTCNTLLKGVSELKEATAKATCNWKTYKELAWVGADDIVWKNEEKCNFYQYSGFFKKSKTGVSIIVKNTKPETVNQFAIDVLLLAQNISVK